MHSAEFQEWLKQFVGRKIASDYNSRCLSVERVLNIDLDEEFKTSEGMNVIKQLQYTIADERKSAPPPNGFTFKKGANIKVGMRTKRSAVKRYFDFLKTKPF